LPFAFLLGTELRFFAAGGFSIVFGSSFFPSCSEFADGFTRALEVVDEVNQASSVIFLVSRPDFEFKSTGTMRLFYFVVLRLVVRGARAVRANV
jgi:hypothetical protein